MSEYIKVANDFCEKHDVKIEIEFRGKEVNELWDEYQPRNAYDVKITTPLGSMEFTYWDSFHNTSQNIMHPNENTNYEILFCLQKDDVGTYREFLNEFGYDEENENSEKIYRLVMKEWEDIERIFTEEQIEMLREIFR